MTCSGWPWGSLSLTSTGITTGVSMVVEAASSTPTGVAGVNAQRTVLADAVTLRRVRCGPLTDHVRLLPLKGTVNAPWVSGERPAAK